MVNKNVRFISFYPVRRNI